MFYIYVTNRHDDLKMSL